MQTNNIQEMPELIMMCGIAASGKSSYAETLSYDYAIHSSDKIRKELFGDANENSKENNEKVFQELHRRIKEDLKAGKNAIYDATNINRKRRMAFLREIKNIPCHKTCLMIMSPYYVCLQNNKKRDRHVPEHVIKRMYMNYQPPHKSEGWDDIDIMFSCTKSDFSDYDIGSLYNRGFGIDFFNQCNSHHQLTLGEHCRKAAEYILENYPRHRLLHIATLLHDEGKIFTQTNINARGEKDGECHYYQHHCVSAYDSIFFMYNMGYHAEDIIHVASLIYFHMHPYQWKRTRSVDRRLKEQIGDVLFDEIMALHEADEYAH